MNTTLVAGATGQLGFAATGELLARGVRVRALLRDPAAAPRFHALGVETAFGDLTKPATLAPACEGVDTIVATANASLPTRSADTLEAVERHGYRNLLAAAQRAGVRRFVYTSVPPYRGPGGPALFRLKQETAHQIAASGMDHVIFQADVFMDVAFAMMGSDIPIRGTASPSVLRDYRFSRRFFRSVSGSIESRHVALVPGDGTVRHSYICVADVARFLGAAATGGPSGTHRIGGPEALSPLDVVRIYERLLGYPIAPQFTPAWMFRVIATLLGPFQPTAANLMWINYAGATEETIANPEASRAFGVSLTTAEQFLGSKLKLPCEPLSS